MGNYQSNIVPLNNKCPISLKDINKNNIMLKCRHVYDNLSIQKYCYLNIILEKKNLCPVCRKEITKQDLKKIFKKWCLIELKYDNWNQLNVFDLRDISDFSCKLNTYKLNDDMLLIQPLFYFDGKYSPVLVATGFIKSLQKIIINKNSKLYKDRETIYGEYLDDLILKYSSSFITEEDYLYYHLYLCRIIPEFKYNGKKILRNNKNKIDFYVDKFKNVISYDVNEGDMKEKFIYKQRSCNVLFSTYLLYYNKKLVVINKIYSIIYS